MVIAGELYSLSATGLAELDRIEGVWPLLGFQRTQIDLSDAHGRDAGTAWCYMKHRHDLAIIHGEPKTEYLRDDRYVLPADRG